MRIRKRKWWIAPAMLTAGLVVALVLVASEEDEIPSGLAKRPLSVDIVQATAQTLRADIPAWGLIAPREQIDIRPQVQGVVASVGRNLMAGASVTKDEVLFTIDPRDYEAALAEARAAYQQAQQAFEIEKGQQQIARAEYAMLSRNGSRIKKSALALREPQRKEREAALAMAKAKKDRAQIDVERTNLVAPCDGQIMHEEVAAGQYMDVGAQALTIACTDHYHVLVSFSPQQRPDPTIKDVHVVIDGQRHPATLASILPQIDTSTRQKQALIILKGKTLPLGAYVSVALKGEMLNQVTALPRSALRADNTIWVLREDSTLDIVPVTLAAQNDKQIFVNSGLAGNARVITSHIATPLKGMELRLLEGTGNRYAGDTMEMVARGAE
jgi:RND family efflux transporter MFP subunit